jgi:Fur family transcriptional regulator, iron response regulator
MDEAFSILRKCGIQPTSQRLAVVEHIIGARDHSSTDPVLEKVRADCPIISRATVYNTLNLLA